MNSNHRAIRPLLLFGIASLAIVVASSGCGWIKNKTHYQDSKEGTPLEVPPDLDKPDTSSATSLPTAASAGVPQSSGGTRFGYLTLPAADAYPKVGEILTATPGVAFRISPIFGKASATDTGMRPKLVEDETGAPAVEASGRPVAADVSGMSRPGGTSSGTASLLDW